MNQSNAHQTVTTTDEASAFLSLLEKEDDMSTLCNSCKALATQVINFVNEDRLDKAAACTARMLDIYTSTAKPLLRTAIENVYVYHVGQYVLLHPPEHSFSELFPDVFCALLKKQMTASNI